MKLNYFGIELDSLASMLPRHFKSNTPSTPLSEVELECGNELLVTE